MKMLHTKNKIDRNVMLCLFAKVNITDFNHVKHRFQLVSLNMVSKNIDMADVQNMTQRVVIEFTAAQFCSQLKFSIYTRLLISRFLKHKNVLI